MRYWWVNHNKTGREEVEHQYLWSPKTEPRKSGKRARSQFYDNMRLAKPGDLVLSYFGQSIRYVGRVAEFAFTAPKPKEFGNKGAYWSDEGWLLPVFWTPLSAPVRPKEIMGELRPLLPTKHSPLNQANDDGSQKAYLAEIPREAFQTVLSATSFNQLALMRGGANSLTFQVVSDLLDDAVERTIEDDPDLGATVKRAVVQARRGQGKFRANVEAIEPACRLTGITNPSLLIASHIKPWRLCTTAAERLDGMNGLLLTPDADLLFDRGFISFEDDGEVKVSPRVDRDDLRRLGFEKLAMERFGLAEAPARWQTAPLAAPRSEYMAYHRRQVFIA